METNIALIATGYLLNRLGIAAAFGYLVYRALRHKNRGAQYQPALVRPQQHLIDRSLDR